MPTGRRLEPLPRLSGRTPVEPLDALASRTGRDRRSLWVKRDDLSSLPGGGSKARALEHLCGEAIRLGCDVLVTGGPAQSNHARLTAAAANRLGLDCTLVLAGPTDAEDGASGNLTLVSLLKADIVWAGDIGPQEAEQHIEFVGAELTSAGRRPYCIPIGGASAVGGLGYVEASRELTDQLPELDLVVMAVGSGGMMGGLAAGFGSYERALGVSVGAVTDPAERVIAQGNRTARLAGLAAPAGNPDIDEGGVGDGYGKITGDGSRALHLCAELEGLILDPIYTAEAMGALLRRLGEGDLADRRCIVFIHSGGVPVLFTPEWVPASTGSG